MREHEPHPYNTEQLLICKVHQTDNKRCAITATRRHNCACRAVLEAFAEFPLPIAIWTRMPSSSNTGHLSPARHHDVPEELLSCIEQWTSNV